MIRVTFPTSRTVCTRVSGRAGSPLTARQYLVGCATLSQALRLAAVRTREEIGGVTPEEWRKARNAYWQTTILALNTEIGQVVSMTHPDVPGGVGSFRIMSWRLKKDWEAVFHDAGVTEEASHELGDAQAFGRACDLGGAGDDFRGIADGIDLDDVVHVVALNLPGDAGERHQVIGDHDDVVGIHRVGQGEAERTAGRCAVGAVGVAEGIGGRRGDHRDVNVYLTVLDGLPTAAMRAQDSHAAHVALGAVVAQRAVHRAFDVMDDAFLHQVNGALLRGEGCAGEPHQVFDAEAGGGFKCHERDAVAVAQVVMVGEDHAVAQSAVAQSSLEIGHALVAVLGKVFIRSDRRGLLAAAGLILADADVRDLGLAVDHGGYHASGGILREFHAIGHSSPYTAGLCPTETGEAPVST